MTNILLILVGGTICTSLNEKGRLDVNGNAGAVLTEGFYASSSPFKEHVRFCVTENLGILSENMTAAGWNRIIDTYKKYIGRQNFDGVIIAHGTDTLAFTASLFAQLLQNTDIPVIFVSANKRPDDENSNAAENFRYATECIAMGICPNVYALYRNISDKRVYLHAASRLEQCKNYSEDFYSVGTLDITDITIKNCQQYFDILKKRYKKSSGQSLIDIKNDITLKDCVLCIPAYVGINYSAMDYEKFSAVLHRTYHSGTVCAEGENSAIGMIDRCVALGVDVYFSPSRFNGEIYESLGRVGEHAENKGNRVGFLYGTTFETSFAKLVIAYSVIDDEDLRAQFIQTENCNESIYG